MLSMVGVWLVLWLGHKSGLGTSILILTRDRRSLPLVPISSTQAVCTSHAAVGLDCSSTRAQVSVTLSGRSFVPGWPTTAGSLGGSRGTRASNPGAEVQRHTVVSDVVTEIVRLWSVSFRCPGRPHGLSMVDRRGSNGPY